MWRYELGALLGKSLQEIDELPLEEVQGWCLYIQEPRGERRMDYLVASVVQAVCGVSAGLGGGRPPKLQDCMLRFNTEENTAEQRRLNMARSMMSLSALVGKPLTDRIAPTLGLTPPQSTGSIQVTE